MPDVRQRKSKPEAKPALTMFCEALRTMMTVATISPIRTTACQKISRTRLS